MLQEEASTERLRRSRIRAELRDRRIAGWSTERLETWLDNLPGHSNNGFSPEEVEYARRLIKFHPAYR